LQQQEVGIERGAYFDHGIEKWRGSRRTVDRFGFVDGGNYGRRRTFMEREEQIAALAEVGQPVAEVGSEGDAGGAVLVDGWHVKSHGQLRLGDATRTGWRRRRGLRASCRHDKSQ